MACARDTSVRPTSHLTSISPALPHASGELFPKVFVSEQTLYGLKNRPLMASMSSHKWSKICNRQEKTRRSGSWGWRKEGCLVPVREPGCTAELAFFAVFQLRISSGLPLHIGGGIGAAIAKWLDVINDVTGAGSGRPGGGRAGVLAFEFSNSGAASGNPAGVVTRRDAD